MWTEESIEAIPREDNFIERKSSRLLDLVSGANRERVRDELAKQLSAFANAGGGAIILGVDNSGMIDGGIPLVLRGRQTTKEWLEDIIPDLTEPEIVGVQVIDVKRENTTSKIELGKAVYVVEVPDSDRAPHQSTRDHIYYVRLGSRSLPAPHRLIEDIRNRSRHPKVVISRAAIAEAQSIDSDDGDGCLFLTIKLLLRNEAPILARNICLDLAVNTENGLRGCIELPAVVRKEGTPGTLRIEVQQALYPKMELVVSPVIHLPTKIFDPVPTVREWAFFIGGRDPSDVTITVTLYADSAPALVQSFGLSEIDSDGKLSRELDRVRSEWFHPSPPPEPIYLSQRARISAARRKFRS